MGVWEVGILLKQYEGMDAKRLLQKTGSNMNLVVVT